MTPTCNYTVPNFLAYNELTKCLEGTPTECGVWKIQLNKIKGMEHLDGLVHEITFVVVPPPAPYAFAGIPSGRQRRAPRGRRTAEQRK